MSTNNQSGLKLLRLAFVQEWSDAMLEHAVGHVQKASPDRVFETIQKACYDLSLSAIRGGDQSLAESGAMLLGFSSFDEFETFKFQNPNLSKLFKANLAKVDHIGLVVAQSATEVVIFDSQNFMYFDRAQLEIDIELGDVVRVDKSKVSVIFNSTTYCPPEFESKYQSGLKYHGLIEEIKYLPVACIERQEMDFRPEVMKVSDEVAANMDFSEPVEVTAYRYSKGQNDVLPFVTLSDEHHRLAAAIQTNRAYLPVQLKAVNAKGEKLNTLVHMSRKIEANLNMDLNYDVVKTTSTEIDLSDVKADSHDSLVIGMFLSKGYFSGINSKYEPQGEQGGIEVVTKLSRYVEPIALAMARADALNYEYPDVFDYQVTEPLGGWIRSQQTWPSLDSFRAELHLRLSDFFADQTCSDLIDANNPAAISEYDESIVL